MGGPFHFDKQYIKMKGFFMSSRPRYENMNSHNSLPANVLSRIEFVYPLPAPALVILNESGKSTK
jgi:hypothetical protein